MIRPKSPRFQTLDLTCHIKTLLASPRILLHIKLYFSFSCLIVISLCSYIYLSLSLFLSLPISLSPYLFLSLSLSLSVSLPIPIPAHLNLTPPILPNVAITQQRGPPPMDERDYKAKTTDIPVPGQEGKSKRRSIWAEFEGKTPMDFPYEMLGLVAMVAYLTNYL